MALQITPLTPHLGLAVAGVDLEQEIPAAVQQQIRDAWIEGGILLFRGAGTSDEAHLRLSRVFGELEAAATKGINRKDNPYLMALVNDPDTRTGEEHIYEIAGELRVGFIPWHWDQTFMPTIVRGAVLRMVEPAARGGETGFIDAIGAYARLPAALKARIENLEVAYRFTPIQDLMARHGLGVPKEFRIAREGSMSEATKRYCMFPPTVHPLVITQRETGRKVLKYSPHHSMYILGLAPADSDALLREIAGHLTDDRYAYYHKWERNDLIVWDNWRIIHTAAGLPLDCRRHAQRTTIMGDYDLGRYLDPALDKRQGVVSYVD